MSDWRKHGRDFCKSFGFEQTTNFESDQGKGVPTPPLEKAVPEDAKHFSLPAYHEAELVKNDVFQLIEQRVSRRAFSEEALSLQQLSFLLWATQGVKKIVGNNYVTMRTVPSAGARHPFETYLWVNRVEGLEQGMYRYLAIEHELAQLQVGDFSKQVGDAAMGQQFVGDAAVTFIWTAVPYRGEWRYSMGAHKPQLLDAGHVCQNLYIACEAVGLGTCAIAAYLQKGFDTLLGVDGEDEYTVYLSPVGKPRTKVAGQAES